MDGDCSRCEELKKTESHEVNHLILHTAARVICFPVKAEKDAKDWKQKGKNEWKKTRDNFVRDLKQAISALRNSGGGVAFVHISDLDPEDRCLDLFHELVDVRLNDMIEDGSLFVTVYKKDWWSETDLNKDFVAIVVSPSVSVVTLDYKTKLPLDNCIIDPSGTSILKYLRQSLTFKKKKATIRGLDFNKLRENRYVQVKAVFDNSGKHKTISTFIDYVWEDLRLREYITAFSKIDGGGSLFIGIQEEQKEYKTYSTKYLSRKGFKFGHSKDQFITLLKEKVINDIVGLVRDGNGVKNITLENLIEVEFHRPPHTPEDYYILEVAVAAVEGLVFYDANGPEAYEIDEENGTIKRMSLRDWGKRLFNQFRKPSTGTQT